MSANLPKAYKDGFQNFYGRDFKVTPSVLIPRPETEFIIDTVLNLAGKAYLPGVKPTEAKIPKNPTILDVGTGSGCIAITLKLELEKANLVASDLSDAALRIAKENAKKFGVKIKFIESNLLENIGITPDIIVANLPYVDETWDWLDKEALSQEPRLALYAKNHGLELIYNLIDQASTRNVKRLILEADPCQHEDIAEYAKPKNYNLVETRGYILHFLSSK